MVAPAWSAMVKQGAGGVLVEHAGLVDEEDVAGQQPGEQVDLGTRRVDVGPVPVVVPSVAVLVDQPGGGERVGADLLPWRPVPPSGWA